MTSTRTTPPHVLIVEDDVKTADMVALYLRHAGLRATTAHSGRRAAERIETDGYDLYILDVMLPEIDGRELCTRIRERADTPILLLTAQSLEDQIVSGLELGADDYVTKPFSPRELVARVQALLRRAPADRTQPAIAGKLRIDPEERRVSWDGTEVSVTPSEFAVLCGITERPGRVLTRGQLLERIPTRGERPMERIVDVHVRNLRAKLAEAGGDPGFIETVFGVGYRCSP